MDVSDGLVQDVGHLARAAGLGATLHADAVPRSVGDLAWRATCLTGGDDYELVMAVRDGTALQAAAAAQGVNVTRIGTFGPGSGVIVLDAGGERIELDRPGWSHF